MEKHMLQILANMIQIKEQILLHDILPWQWKLVYIHPTIMITHNPSVMGLNPTNRNIYRTMTSY